MCHFKDNHSCTECGRFLVPLLKKSGVKAYWVSQDLKLCRDFSPLNEPCTPRVSLMSLELLWRNIFVMGHAELVPVADLQKPYQMVFYLPMHVVQKESSTTTKVRAVFDASATSTYGVSLNACYLSAQLFIHR